MGSASSFCPSKSAPEQKVYVHGIDEERRELIGSTQGLGIMPKGYRLGFRVKRMR
jgi:hypothetical protein